MLPPNAPVWSRRAAWGGALGGIAAVVLLVAFGVRWWTVVLVAVLWFIILWLLVIFVLGRAPDGDRRR